MPVVHSRDFIWYSSFDYSSRPCYSDLLSPPSASLQNDIWNVGGVGLWLVSPRQQDGPLDLCGGSDPPLSGLPLSRPGLAPSPGCSHGSLGGLGGGPALWGQVSQTVFIWQSWAEACAGWSVREPTPSPTSNPESADPRDTPRVLRSAAAISA